MSVSPNDPAFLPRDRFLASVASSHDDGSDAVRVTARATATAKGGNALAGGPLVGRRTLLKMLAATSVLPLAACGEPTEAIVPYVDMPEGLVAGQSRFYASAFELEGIATGVLAESHEGRPTKIEGNPDHPASRGGTDAFQQAALLSLYDPGRASLVRRAGDISSYDAFLAELVEWRTRWSETGGEGLSILVGDSGSPTRRRLLAALAAEMPALRLFRWAPVGRDNERAGMRLAFGQDAAIYLRLENADAIVALDADFLGPGPEQARLARDYGAARKVRADGTASAKSMVRLLSAGPGMTATASMAGERLAARRSRIDALARAIAAQLGLTDVAVPFLDEGEAAFAAKAAAALAAAGPRGLLLAGEAQPAHVHGLMHRINQRLGSLGPETSRPASLMPTVDMPAGERARVGDLAALVEAIEAGAVRDLVILDANPVYDAPADLDFAAALRKVDNAIHLSLYEDETSEECRWHIPRLHPLEEWSDVVAKDGLVSIVQPLVTPLYEGHSPLALLAAMGGEFSLTDHAAIQANWADDDSAADAAAGSGGPGFWMTTLARGFVEGSPARALEGIEARGFGPPPLAASSEDGFEIVFSPDPSVWDGRFSNNAWLQETPRPFTSEVWGNAAAMNPADHRRLGLFDGAIVAIEAGDRRIVVPTLALPGQAVGTVGLTLGYGRRFGSIARGVGTDVYPLRTTAEPWALRGASVTPTGAAIELALTQASHQMEGRDIARTVPISDLGQKPPEAPDFDGHPPTLYPEYERGPYEWAMVIDQNLCISCNACVVACQAENNVPVVGPEEIRRGRDMHWLRIDSYLSGEEDAPRHVSQPVPCMHCEKAPCEPMCPVGAAIHDSEGLNVQVYNRCVGTRDCQSNCPYKVRRFNFFGYANGQEYADLGEPMMHAIHNPDVTVRARGVMEKCTYCVQRISGARRQAEKEDREIEEGEVITACQQACPSQAITFGNLSDESSTVNALRREPHHYALLEELGTRPRTTYLAKVEDRMGDTGARKPA